MRSNAELSPSVSASPSSFGNSRAPGSASFFPAPELLFVQGSFRNLVRARPGGFVLSLNENMPTSPSNFVTE